MRKTICKIRRQLPCRGGAVPENPRSIMFFDCSGPALLGAQLSRIQPDGIRPARLARSA
jgi:hypothetical protein